MRSHASVQHAEGGPGHCDMSLPDEPPRVPGQLKRTQVGVESNPTSQPHMERFGWPWASPESETAGLIITPTPSLSLVHSQTIIRTRLLGEGECIRKHKQTTLMHERAETVRQTGRSLKYVHRISRRSLTQWPPSQLTLEQTLPGVGWCVPSTAPRVQFFARGLFDN